MASQGYEQEFDSLLKSYLSLGDHAVAIVGALKKARKAEIRCKLVGELGSLDFMQLALVGQLNQALKRGNHVHNSGRSRLREPRFPSLGGNR